MDIKIIEAYDRQYNIGGGCWNKKCIINCKIETYSGPGSLVKNTDNIIDKLPLFLNKFNIKSIIDIPCGDFNFMSKIDFTGVNYKGVDISKKAIQLCKKYETDNIKFECGDILNDNYYIDDVDLIICKDLTLHLSFNDIHKLLDRIKKSKCKYFAVSRYNKCKVTNRDTKDGKSGLGARCIEVTKPPFNFNYPEIERIKYSNSDLMDELVFFNMTAGGS